MVPSLFKVVLMSKPKLLIVSAAVVGTIAVILGFLLFSKGTEESEAPQPVMVEEDSIGLGISYLPVTRGLSEYYGLGVDYGALVTEVTPGSPADQGGVKTGDVILSFNNVTLEPKAQLLGMMMACPAGNTVTLEVWRETGVQVIKLFHGAR